MRETIQYTVEPHGMRRRTPPQLKTTNSLIQVTASWVLGTVKYNFRPLATAKVCP